ncbi:MAG TPA: hypothetical protein DEH11_16705, partial [Actinobacteria bacterium]|nr:hypothetical protein [Actinomycetota bacterium]
MGAGSPRQQPGAAQARPDQQLAARAGELSQASVSQASGWLTGRRAAVPVVLVGQAVPGPARCSRSAAFRALGAVVAPAAPPAGAGRENVVIATTAADG